ncbi:MAG: protein XcpP [Pseudomonas sp.]|jgi:type II secretory pathway component PulC|uniref:Uncharacterized protein n=1 Tax=Pseudomonas gorinensis TaxID=3240790 RepID=A0ACA7NZD7_9PSED|nr:hypothetical protein U771_02470 [Pseudomonas sp. TKP]MBL1308718.1 protein XcpP [Pseudomonas sp.]PMX18176.1 protein XcpP [Pseudomonas sp. MPBC4-3]PMX21659.1 protein XcpP [Pseudomonas sp. GW460-12]PMX30360.1 protein XcpP [Pseudomonas sp. MPR-R2A4]PMX32578.1 protein XcpP [Pseudomonas sp. MPR-R2A7]PMX46618.1 protein XcpP [Pseudomonas sp. MPR-R2A6]PMX50714.1 protein XcpP [Pseudomonas sp. FW301-21B01]PMX93787.1 protein XcpP [Pseudomonas sp. MPR-R2A3]PMY11124.1 protein XcpP [Pseudomonas sp. MP
MKTAGWRVLVLMLPLGYGLMLAWQEWQFRQARMPAAQALPVPSAMPQPTVALDTLAVASVLGLSAQGGALSSAEPLTLRATVVASDSESRALLAGPDSERFYRAGERLPGGSLLRRIEPAQVVLWRQGREELLRLHPASGGFLQPAHAQRKATAALHLRPMVEQPRSE